ncbi:MAG: hypothetical protein A2W91_14865 [Bacteroidetes bacterium GWF2_38_335]|nr:MAG: hypothetical protein A2W91_14865 [Bacteroidetes bacterium GWF2_38_335]OFY78481.1 MAG: hypothetical protein A2281_16175 [Bacteroidetes bacterium RIFOXYA12_FULL_38_20]HBS88430.1 glycosyl transferase family 2 [Bacteroidales bacterium]
MIVAQVIFWLLIFLIFHTYVLYPVILWALSGKKNNPAPTVPDENLPGVSILMSAFNEEVIIEEKIRSIFKTGYPLHKIEVLIGSDNSSDNTNNIIEKLQKEFSNIQFISFTQRQGKPAIINILAGKSKYDILVITDANVIFTPDTLISLTRHFNNPEIGLVDSHMMNIGLKKEGISIQENAYNSREMKIKNRESKIWGTMIGPFGGCYAIRKELFSVVPANFTVDDFYISMKVLEKGKKAINDLEAIVYEDVSNNIQHEFRRKVRIASGNFQNLQIFKGLLWPPFTGIAFCFFSHKVLRWLTPFFIILSFYLNVQMAMEIKFYDYLLMAYCFVLLLPLADFLLKKINIHIILLRFITHFFGMNLALFSGFIKYFKGIESNVWKPTKRNQ